VRLGLRTINTRTEALDVLHSYLDTNLKISVCAVLCTPPPAMIGKEGPTARRAVATNALRSSCVNNMVSAFVPSITRPARHVVDG
jgi:hypothetical protein